MKNKSFALRPAPRLRGVLCLAIYILSVAACGNGSYAMNLLAGRDFPVVAGAPEMPVVRGKGGRHASIALPPATMR